LGNHNDALPFTGWTHVGEFDFFVRQFRDMKIIPDSKGDRTPPQRVRLRLPACAGQGARA
jgi:hypothetical protein